MKEEEATGCNINPHVATVITAAKRCPLCLELKVSKCALHCGKRGICVTCFPRKKNPASRKVRERDGEREDRVEHKVSGFRQLLTIIDLFVSFYIG